MEKNLREHYSPDQHYVCSNRSERNLLKKNSTRWRVPRYSIVIATSVADHRWSIALDRSRDWHMTSGRACARRGVWPASSTRSYCERESVMIRGLKTHRCAQCCLTIGPSSSLSARQRRRRQRRRWLRQRQTIVSGRRTAVLGGGRGFTWKSDRMGARGTNTSRQRRAAARRWIVVDRCQSRYMVHPLASAVSLRDGGATRWTRRTTALASRTVAPPAVVDAARGDWPDDGGAHARQLARRFERVAPHAGGNGAATRRRRACGAAAPKLILSRCRCSFCRILLAAFFRGAEDILLAHPDLRMLILQSLGFASSFIDFYPSVP